MIPALVKTQIKQVFDQLIVTNNTQAITADVLNGVLTDLLNAIDSNVVELDNAPTVAARLRIWRNGNYIKVIDDQRQGSAFSSIITTLENNGDDAIMSIDLDTGLINFDVSALVAGPYDDDTAAINDGLGDGRLYEVSDNNPYPNIPGGFVRVLRYDENAVAYNDGLEPATIYNDGNDVNVTYNA